MTTSPDPSFTGRRRTRVTRRSVLLWDHAAHWIISIGGMGTILAVCGVALFLVWVVLPLFLPARIAPTTVARPAEGEIVGVGIDEYRLLAWTLRPSGRLDVHRTDDGALRESRQLVPEGMLGDAAVASTDGRAVLGLRDGTLQLARLGFETRIRNLDDLPDDVAERLAKGADGTVVDLGSGVVEKTPQGQARQQALAFEEGRHIVLDGAVEKVALAELTDGLLVLAVVRGPAAAEAPGEAAVAVDEAGAGAGLRNGTDPEPGAGAGPTGDPDRGDEDAWRLVAVPTVEKSDFLTGRSTVELGSPVELPILPRDEPPRFLGVGGAGTEAWLAWEDGWSQRLDIRDLGQAFVAETGRLLDVGRLTAFDFVLGNTTLIWGSSEGEITAGFLARPGDLTDPEAPGLFDREVDPRTDRRLVRAKALSGPRGAAVLAFGPSIRSRLVLAGFADGTIDLYNVTNETRLTRTVAVPGEPVRQLLMAPKEDGLLALVGDGFRLASLDPRYPEASLRALFRPVWYEGYGGPQHIWQSSSATDDFEMKLGLVPLVFGTIKATFYSMLFGAPLALLAAIFTSEFLDTRTRSIVKPSIELMASLPSVVLGFLAALVFAPVVEEVVPATLAAFVTLPFVFLVGAYAWQLLPQRWSLGLEHRRFLFILAVLPLGFLLAAWLGPVLEAVFFGGDLKAWLSWSGEDPESRFASATGGWMMLLVPLSAVAVVAVQGRIVTPWMRHRSAEWDRNRYALADACRFLVLAFATVALAWTVSALLSATGFDPRGTYVDTYVQRNALIVGFVMGFAVIPIIYTISEDALSTVPEHLRSASLGAGATRWQTAVRIVLPTAMSGLFSALMVGLGRAVGETMIVLMAAGNTPVLEWNVFEGFRTLSANIAVELPEAVRNSTHYRTLFLAALTLFVMTFAVNTIAEVIRLRFRKRAYQL